MSKADPKRPRRLLMTAGVKQETWRGRFAANGFRASVQGEEKHPPESQRARMDLWAYGPMDPAQGPNPWAHPMDLWTSGPPDIDAGLIHLKFSRLDLPQRQTAQTATRFTESLLPKLATDCLWPVS